MSRTEITLTLPEGTQAGWHERFTDRLTLRLGEILDDLGRDPPLLMHRTDDLTGQLSIGQQVVPISYHADPIRAAEAAFARLHGLRWPVVIAPALAARGVAQGWWLRHAARRGLAIDDIQSLGKGAADDEAVAWRLAERHPLDLHVFAGRDARAVLHDATERKAEAMRAAAMTGLPILIPDDPKPDAALDADQARLRIGALRGPGFAAADLSGALIAEAPAMIDPAVVIALLTDETRLTRRLATLALARTGAPRFAQMMVVLTEQKHAVADIAALAEAAAGLVADVEPGAVMAPATHGLAAQFAAMALRGFAAAR